MGLKPFQIEGATFLSQRTRALLADEPGVGKTAQIITACNQVEARRVGIVCPSIGVEHWRRECQKWGLKGKPTIIAWDDAHKVQADLTECGGPAKLPAQWDVLVLDECHFGKNPQARRTQAAFQYNPKAGRYGLGSYAHHIWAASGTPAPNNASELWPLLRAFGRTKMDHRTFTEYFCVVDQAGKPRRNRPEHIDELRGILKSFSLRRLKKHVLPELGEIDVQEWYVKPSRDFVLGDLHEVTHRNSQLEAELRDRSDDEILEFLRYSAEEFSTLRRYNALLKAPAVFDTVKFELENGLLDKVVIYGYHKEALAALQRAFLNAGIGCGLVYGDTPPGDRDRIIQRWKREPQIPVMLASLVIASTVLDFTCAHQGIMLEMDWVPGNNWQAMQRMHRHGQENPVTVRVALGTPVDEIVTGVLVRKTKDIAEIFD